MCFVCGIDEEGIELHRRELLGRHRPGEDPVLVAGSLETLGEHVKEPGVVIDDGYSKCCRLGAHGRGREAKAGFTGPASLV